MLCFTVKLSVFVGETQSQGCILYVSFGIPLERSGTNRSLEHTWMPLCKHEAARFGSVELLCDEFVLQSSALFFGEREIQQECVLYNTRWSCWPFVLLCCWSDVVWYISTCILEKYCLRTTSLT